MKRLVCIFFSLFALTSAEIAVAQISDINSAINKAGRQRMLSQRIAKTYFQIGAQIDQERSRKVLDASLALFDRQLVELKNFAPTAELKDTYARLEKSWLAYKDVLIGATPTLDGGRKVLSLSEEVLALAHKGTQQFEALAGTTTGRLVNIAGRQRMLSQRMAKFYQASAWGVSDTAAQAELDKARKEFAAAHQELSSSPANTPQVKDALELVRQQWVFFDLALNQKSRSDRQLSGNVATTSERILEEMEGVVSLYEKLPVR